MRELAGRLHALDPEATESLKVIEYFDSLVDGRVGVEGMLRGASVLAGVPVGYRAAASRVTLRYGADGARLPDSEDGAASWVSHRLGDGGIVWLERVGARHASDAMILERLAISLLLHTRRLDSTAPVRRAVELLVDGGGSDAELDAALSRLAFPARTPIFAVAVSSTCPIAAARAVPEAIIGTRHGVVRAMLTTGADTPACRAGVGVPAHSAREIRDSWRSALIALRLSDDSHPVLHAAELGPLLALVEIEDRKAQPHPDVAGVTSALTAGWSLEQLEQIGSHLSTRALAAAAGVHHSTMDARLRKLPSLLGFDPAARGGATRLHVALMLHRLVYAHISEV